MLHCFPPNGVVQTIVFQTFKRTADSTQAKTAHFPSCSSMVSSSWHQDMHHQTFRWKTAEAALQMKNHSWKVPYVRNDLELWLEGCCTALPIHFANLKG